jgi:hypothetical protein
MNIAGNIDYLKEELMRKSYEMTEADLASLLSAMKPELMIALQCGTPPSIQERANRAWSVLGATMGFDFTTVSPNGRGDRFFTAEATA